MKHTDDIVTITIPSKEEYIGLVRLLVSGFASKWNFSYDEIEEMKIAVSEICLNSVKYAYQKESPNNVITIICKAHDGNIEIDVKDAGKGFDTHKQEAQNGFGFTFLKQYMELIDLESKIGEGTTVKFQKHHYA